MKNTISRTQAKLKKKTTIIQYIYQHVNVQVSLIFILQLVTITETCYCLSTMNNIFIYVKCVKNSFAFHSGVLLRSDTGGFRTTLVDWTM